MQELQTSQQNLRQLAEETGGVAFVGRNNFDDAFDRIVQENSSYYVLGYYSTNDRRDGKLRNITRARRGISGCAGHLSQALCRAARPRAEEHGGRQAARPDRRA